MHSNEIQDYRLLVGDIGITELQGRRNAQEDRVAFGELEDFEKLSEVEKAFVLRNTIEIIEDIIVEENLGLHQGSTLCSTVLLGNQIYTSHVGDSAAFVCILNKKGKTIIFKQLNQVHHPDREDERERIETAGGKVSTHILGIPRLMGQLALSRALGDRSFESVGLIHDAEICIPCPYIADIPPEGKGFVITACDGLTEDNKLSAENICSIIEANQTELPHIIASQLATSAFDSGVGDNISVMVTSIKSSAKQAKFMTVFDGHGGDQIADVASQLYDTILRMQTAAILTSVLYKKKV